MHSLIPYHALKAHHASFMLYSRCNVHYGNVICNVTLKPDETMNCIFSLIFTLIVISCQRAKFSNMDNHGPPQKKKQKQAKPNQNKKTPKNPIKQKEPQQK